MGFAWARAARDAAQGLCPRGQALAPRATHPTVFQREAMEKMSGLKGVKSMDSSFAYLFKGLDEGRMAKIRAIGKEIAVKSGQQRFRKGEEAKIFLGEL